MVWRWRKSRLDMRAAPWQARHFDSMMERAAFSAERSDCPPVRARNRAARPSPPAMLRKKRTALPPSACIKYILLASRAPTRTLPWLWPANRLLAFAELLGLSVELSHVNVAGIANRDSM